MAASPSLKVYNPSGEYVAACKYVEDAAAIVALYGDGATIRNGHRVKDTVWHEGQEEQDAGESFDHVARTVNDRRIDRERERILLARLQHTEG